MMADRKEFVMKKIITLIMAACLTLTSLSACGCAKKEEALFMLDGYTLNKSEYLYWMSYYKTSFVNVFTEAGYVDPDEYNEDFWNTSTPEGDSLRSMTVDRVDDSVKKLLVCLKLFDEYGLDQNSEIKKSIQTAVDEKIAENIDAVGSRSVLNKELAQYGLSINSLMDLYDVEYRRAFVLDHLYGDNGIEKITQEERDTYYKENYHRIKHILIDLNEKYVLDDKGERVMDPATGYYKTEKLTDDEKAERKKLAEQILAKAQAGEDFEKLIEEYGEDEGMTYYTDGYYVKEGDSYEENFLNAALEMNVDEVRLVESTYGMHIMKKYPLPEQGYTKEINVNFFSGLDDLVGEDKENKKLQAYFPQITVDQSVYGAVDFSTVPLMSDGLSGFES